MITVVNKMWLGVNTVVGGIGRGMVIGNSAVKIADATIIGGLLEVTMVGT